MIDQAENLKAGIRAKVMHPFRVIKRQFGFVKVRYRGLKKNTAQLITPGVAGSSPVRSASLIVKNQQLRIKTPD